MTDPGPGASLHTARPIRGSRRDTALSARWWACGLVVLLFGAAACGDDVFVPVTDADGDGADADPVGATPGDCDDGDPLVYPGADEICDAQDNDCDAEIDEGYDVDADGYATCVLDSTPADCDDTDPLVNPAAEEVCNGIDDDCDGDIDQDASDMATWYYDGDGDDYGLESTAESACERPEDYVADGSDCDDTRDESYPGALERCDGLDNNCNGTPDEGLSFKSYYPDQDDDGYGDDGEDPVAACATPPGMVGVDGDCDDDDPLINPAATEVCDGEDNNCDGEVDEDEAVDAPTWYEDVDADGWGDEATATVACDAPPDHVDQAGDCDDDDPAVNPDATETCDGVDNDCDTVVDEDLAAVYYRDSDDDGYGSSQTTQACSQPTGYTDTSGDCNDQDAKIYPGATETCNTKDDDCDGTTDEGLTKTYYRDADNDGYGTSTSTVNACTPPTGYTTTSTDCNDANDDINPGATEICNQVDDDCDTQKDEKVCCTWTMTWRDWKVIDVYSYTIYADPAAQIEANEDDLYDPPPYGASYSNAEEKDVFKTNWKVGDSKTVNVGTALSIPVKFTGYEWDLVENDIGVDNDKFAFTCSGSGSLTMTLRAEVPFNCTLDANVDMAWVTP